MPEQLELFRDADVPKSIPAVSGVEKVQLETLDTGVLESLFQQGTGFDARIRFLGQEWPEERRRAILIEGIENPKAGKESVTEWDVEYEKIGDPHSKK